MGKGLGTFEALPSPLPLCKLSRTLLARGTSLEVRVEPHPLPRFASARRSPEERHDALLLNPTQQQGWGAGKSHLRAATSSLTRTSRGAGIARHRPGSNACVYSGRRFCKQTGQGERWPRQAQQGLSGKETRLEALVRFNTRPEQTTAPAAQLPGTLQLPREALVLGNWCHWVSRRGFPLKLTTEAK